jgi:hypothetical protein
MATETVIVAIFNPSIIERPACFLVGSQPSAVHPLLRSCSKHPGTSLFKTHRYSPIQFETDGLRCVIYAKKSR